MATERRFDRAHVPDREKIPATNVEIHLICQFVRYAMLICAMEARKYSQTSG